MVAVLVVEDNKGERDLLIQLMNGIQYNGNNICASGAENGKEALIKLSEQEFGLVLSDIQMPVMGGVEFLQKIKERKYPTPVIMITAYNTNTQTLRNLGADEFITKPITKANLEGAISNCLRINSIDFKQLMDNAGILSSSQRMLTVVQKAHKAARIDIPILIQGESGTGKELIVKFIHANSSRSGKPLVSVNCAALPEHLLESELFGHVKGAFTGAIKDKKGRFELANQGTIFLDEIGDMEKFLQAKLLRVLENGEIQKVGSEKIDSTVDVRVIAATHVDIEQKVKERTFREDLYYRLNVFNIYIPPLRERKEEILPLAEYFMKKAAQKSGKKIEQIHQSVIQSLQDYSWPGNVRQLEHCIEAAVVLCGNEYEINKFHLPSFLQGSSGISEDDKLPWFNIQKLIKGKFFSDKYFLDWIKEELVKPAMREALLLTENSNNNTTEAAALLGFHHKYGSSVDGFGKMCTKVGLGPKAGQKARAKAKKS